MRDDAKRRQMFDRLVRRSVLSQSYTIVCENVNNRQFCQSRQANRGPHVVGEDQKSGSVGPDASVQCHAVQDGAHAVLADPKMEVSSPRRKMGIFKIFQMRVGGRRQVSRSAD